MSILKPESSLMSTWSMDIKRPLVSICCTTYNHVNFIEEAIKSFLMQHTSFPFEILIRDDASTDGTVDIIKKYAEKYPNIIRVAYEKINTYSKGVKPLPELFKIAKGKYIALCEGDDFWTDCQKLQIQIDEMEKCKIGMSFHANSQLCNSGRIIEPRLKGHNIVYSVKEIIKGGFHFVQTNTIIFRRLYLKELNFELLNKSPVGDVWIRIATSIPDGALYIDRDMAMYRRNAAGSWSASVENEDAFMVFVNRMIKSIDAFDRYWNYAYTREFRSYKNMYIYTVMRKKNISTEAREKFINSYYSYISLRNMVLWNLVFKNENMARLLNKLYVIVKSK